MAAHAKPKPSPYAIASGAVAYSLAATFHKHLNPDLIAALPAAVAVAVAAVERGVADAEAIVVKVDPKAATAVTAAGTKVDRLAAQAAGAAQDLAAATNAGLSIFDPVPAVSNSVTDPA